jgi:hypothetical protein
LLVEGECQLEILISKKKNIYSSIAIVKENCRSEAITITTWMNYK